MKKSKAGKECTYSTVKLLLLLLLILIINTITITINTNNYYFI